MAISIMMILRQLSIVAQQQAVVQCRLYLITLYQRIRLIKYTNKYNLPEAVFNALKRDNYDKGKADYSITEILNPPQLVQLRRRYYDELEEDVMDNVWSILGRAAHHILENHAGEDTIAESRLYTTVKDRIIGGQVDNYHDKVITDYKITSAYTLVYGSRIEEWEEQLNGYAYLFRQHDFEVERLQIVAILRDWQESKAKQDSKYPQTPIVIIPLNLWTEAEQREFIEGAVYWNILAETTEDEALPLCRPHEMWEQPTKWALMKDGRKTAVRVVETDEECNQLSEQYPINGIDYFWVQRPGARTRCERYCPVSKYCHQYKEYKANANRNPAEEEN